MTSRPKQSYVVHSGFNDLVNLVASSPSRFASKSRSRFSPVQSNTSGLPKLRPQTDYRSLSGLQGPRAHGYTAEDLDPQRQKGPPVPPKEDRCDANGHMVRPRKGAGEELKKRKVDKWEIGPPTDFRHIFHASSYEEANELLLRWSAEGLSDKIGDPSWASPIKNIVKARAIEQQARAVAAVVEATARSRILGDVAQYLRPPPGTLRVINGLPSSIYSTQNSSFLTYAQNGNARSNDINRATTTTISPLLARASTPMIIANFPSNFEPETTLPSPLTPPDSPDSGNRVTEASTRSGGTKKTLSLGLTLALPPTVEEGLVPVFPPSNSKKDPRPTIQELFTPLPFRVVKPSLPTLERAMSVGLFFEGYYYPLLNPDSLKMDNPGASARILDPSTPIHHANYPLLRAHRSAQLESLLHSPSNRSMSPDQQDYLRLELQKEERRWLREKRRKVDAKAFEMGRVIGHGAFGVVRIAREKRGGRLVAMKQLRKADMLHRSQEGHVKAEKDLLASATASQPIPLPGLPTQTSRIVQLFYAFQDTDHLYLVLEFMGGGDLLNLLVEKDVFDEDMTKFYVAEMVLALEETHKLGYVHRDIKPDNFLFDKTGHLKVSDFGLATDLHWAHDTNYYEQQRLALLKKHGVELEYPSVKTKRMEKSEVRRILGREWIEEGKGILEWREKNRRKLAYSVCGTNSYMAPEVIRGQGYGFSCDWWSLGIIMYECLYGYPPFTSSSRHVTRQKILNWQQSLKFPSHPHLSSPCSDLLTKLLCEPEDRLGSSPLPTGARPQGRRVPSSGSATGLKSTPAAAKGAGGFEKDGVETIKSHPWFIGIDWESLHLQNAPYQPDLYADDDTRHFDEDIPDEPLAPAGPAKDSKDPLLRNKTHGAGLLEIRKSLAFKGWTFKSPHLNSRPDLEWITNGMSHMGNASEASQGTMGGLPSGVVEKDEPRDTVRGRAISI